MEFYRQYSVTVDDKGRIRLPAEIRKNISGETLVLTKGLEKCLWLYLPEAWEDVSSVTRRKAGAYSSRVHRVVRRVIAPATEVHIDKTGRVKLSLSLMKSVGISKSCYLIGMGQFLELWDEAALDANESEHSSEVQETWEGFAGESSSENSL
ncbi:MAG: hypothetical protein B0D92_05875 [Spirochaeta sp. LUC14_002_19_P3]|nr:MAG: hypothetical protein B0D92_05875 [Spirochaeta sp. LUC14_002_19_P3]